MAAHVTALPASALFWRRTGADGRRAAFRARAFHWCRTGADALLCSQYAFAPFL